ncbi:unnamed protein product, partial [Mesorhabditis spiculigera]
MRNIAAFWLFGMCNNYAYILMLSAAKDINAKGTLLTGIQEMPVLERGTQHCTSHRSTGLILMADIIPSFIMQATAPFYAYKLSYGWRHLLVVLSQAGGLLIVAYSQSYSVAICGVILASLSTGLGESTLVSFSSRFPHSTVVAWASGTGGAGIIGSFIYAALTEPKLVGLSPKNALLVMMMVPLTYALTFWVLLDHPLNIVSLFRGIQDKEVYVENEEQVYFDATIYFYARENGHNSEPSKTDDLPGSCLYFAEYTINQGLFQLIIFDCAHAFGLTKASQYRWFQVLYRAGVFISRSSMAIVRLPSFILYVLPVLQCVMLVFFYFEAIHAFIPHIAIAFGVIFFEGLFGGTAYVKTLNYIHKKASPDVREFSMGVGTISDTVGIFLASFSSILVHNHICDLLG